MQSSKVAVAQLVEKRLSLRFECYKPVVTALLEYFNFIPPTVSEYFDQVVKKFTLQGDYLSKFGSPGSGDGQFNI